MRLPAIRLLLLAVLLACGTALASCEPAAGATELSIEGLGRAYFSDFRVDALRNHAELSGGVCLEDPAGEWTVTAEQVMVTGLQPGQPLNLQVRAARLQLEGWVIEAAHLTSDGNEFVVFDARFEGSGLAGTIGQGAVRLDASGIEAMDLQATGPGYRVSGATAFFDGDVITLGDALITTCICAKAPFYVLEGETAVVDLVGEELHLTRGELVIGRLRIALAEQFEVSSRTLQEITPPVLIEYTASDAAAGVVGHGLSLLVPRLQLAEHLTAELGLLGLDGEHEERLYGLLRYRHDGVNLLLGSTRGGPRADFSVRRPVNGWLDLTFAVNNRHEPEEHYLHEGLLTLQTTFSPLLRPAGERLVFGASLTAAASSQVVARQSVMAPRVRFALSSEYRLPRGELGQLTLAVNTENTSYGAGRNQFGLQLKPSWTLTQGPFTLKASYDWLHTNSASPFSTKLDRLTPVSRLAGSVGWQHAQGGAQLDITASGTYDFLLFPDGSRQGFENLSLEVRGSAASAEWTLRPRLFLQLAGLLDPRAAPQRKAYLEGSFSAERGDLELGVLSRYHLPGGSIRTGFEILEFSVAVPLEFERVKLVPFVGIDVAPLVTGRGGPAVSGHGLEVRFDTCCAVLQAGYRLHDSEMTTSFSASFER